MATPKGGQTRYVDLRSHQRTPRECPALFHAAHDEWQRCRQDDVEPGVQALRAHRPRGASDYWWHVANAVVSSDDYRPECAHDDDEKHRYFRLPEPEQRQGYPADARQRLQAKCKHPDWVCTKLEPAHQQPARQASRNTDAVASQRP